METSPTITARLLRGLEPFMHAQGLAFASMAEQCGVDTETTADPDGVISLEGYFKLLELAAKISGDEAFGLKFGLSHANASAGLFHYLVVSTPTMAEALKASVRFFGLVTNGYSLSYTTDNAVAGFNWHFLTPAEQRRQFSDFVVALVTVRIRHQLGPRWSPLSIDIDHAEPRDASAFNSGLCPSVNFAQPLTRIVMSSASLQQRMLNHDPRLYEMLEGIGRQRLGFLPQSDGIARRAAEVISKLLPKGEESVEQTAEALGISARAFNRELAEVGYTYRDLVDEVRKNMAQELISQTELPLTEIAFIVGFSELSAFSRAAKGWFGEPPSAMRKRLRTN